MATRHQPRHTQPSHWHCSRYMVCACASNRKALLTLARYCAFSMLPHQHIEGADVLLMTLFLQEYGASAGFPLAGSAYLACIDSVQHLTPAAWRTLVYREVLIAYSHHLKSRYCTAQPTPMGVAQPPLSLIDHMQTCVTAAGASTTSACGAARLARTKSTRCTGTQGTKRCPLCSVCGSGTEPHLKQRSSVASRTRYTWVDLWGIAHVLTRHVPPSQPGL